jgi:cytochrome c5
MKKRGTYLLVLTLVGFATLSSTTGCYYDKEELLYPDAACDTANISYSRSIAPIISSSCNSCHSGSSPSFNVRLDNHADLKAQVTNGKIPGVITHASGFSPMPKNAPKLSTCNITLITKWIEAGAPNN